MVGSMIDPDGPEPVYLQLAGILRAQIDSGELPANRLIPSIDHLRQTYGLARGTVLHAIQVLRDEGRVRTVQGRGTYVVPREDGGQE
jgi:GntR family transcriptional regulator